MKKVAAIRNRNTTKHIYVTARPGNPAQGILRAGQLLLPCALGRSGIATFKREGDGASPRGAYPLRRAFYRADRVRRPATRLPLTVLSFEDGWCDATFNRNYNRHVRQPYPASAERMWRYDALYDMVVVVGHNDRPRVQGAGSAIFMHVANAGPKGLMPTEGCIAMRPRDLRLLMEWIGSQTMLHIL